MAMNWRTLVLTTMTWTNSWWEKIDPSKEFRPVVYEEKDAHQVGSSPEDGHEGRRSVDCEQCANQRRQRHGHRKNLRREQQSADRTMDDLS
jgi:hypothetical protein